ncbi:TOBE domain-containing protein [Nocardioides acrostichi]|uniref:TOBE domain-containing protein n=1 Tax=Nocardioides acrostichi TaxID=2784339 RepID=UPI002E2C9DEE|nr:TOBE domain-containing protein [Nocardioides acrostichi]
MTSPAYAYSVAEAAELLGVSDDTMRRWCEAGRVPTRRDAGRTVVDGADLAELAVSLADVPDPGRSASVSARNRMLGLVTRVRKDTVMAQVDMVCGPYRLVSLMSAEAADDLRLAPGARVVASVKSTNVIVELP